jgi:predicted transcriptional regulator
MREITSFPKNSREEVRVSIDEFKGKRIFSLRVFYQDAVGVMRPSKKGLTLTVEKFSEFKEAVMKLEAALEEERAVLGDDWQKKGGKNFPPPTWESQA